MAEHPFDDLAGCRAARTRALRATGTAPDEARRLTRADYPLPVASLRSGHGSDIRTARLFGLLLTLLLLAPIGASSTRASSPEQVTEELGGPIPLSQWQSPPRAARPVARWWWPGGSVRDEVASEQLRRIAQAGFGAVELQPLLLGMGDAELAADPKLRTVGEPGFRLAVARAAVAAAEAGLAFDLTLGSGWPGGLPTAKRNAERQLLMATLDITGPVSLDAPLPAAPDQSYRRAVEWVLDVLGPPDEDTTLVAVLAARLGPERAGVPTLQEVREVTGSVAGDRLKWSVPPGAWRLFALYANSTGHFVMGGAFPGEEEDARVVDHLSQRGADALLESYADPLLAVLGGGAVREVFVDSFELLGELPFSEDFAAAFRRQTGYELTPHLPLLFRRGGESKYGEMMDLFGRNGGPLYLAPEPLQAERIREDYEAVRRTLFRERFVARFAAWAHARALGLRLQAHGGYDDYLDIYALADVPEAEGLFAGGSFDFLKLAASAAHVAGRTWSSSESFITLRLLGTGLSEDEMRLLAGRAYSAGINRLVFHGVPYPYLRQDGAPWFPFPGGFGRILAGPLPMSLEVDAERLSKLPDFNRFVARTSLAMSRGEPAADVAWLRSDPLYPDSASLQIGRIDPRAGESDTTRSLRARGLVHDRVSRRMLAGARVAGDTLEIGAGRYRVLLLDPLPIAEPALVEALASIAAAGIPVLALGALPERAPGLRDAEARDTRVRAASAKLSASAIRVQPGDELKALLARIVTGALVEPAPGEELGVSVARRRTAAGDILLLFNESWSSTHARLRFARAGGRLILWDPRTGSRRLLQESVRTGEIVSLDLAAAECLILTLGRPRGEGQRAATPPEPQ